MDKKRRIKMLMSKGFQRNQARVIDATAPLFAKYIHQWNKVAHGNGLSVSFIMAIAESLTDKELQELTDEVVDLNEVKK